MGLMNVASSHPIPSLKTADLPLLAGLLGVAQATALIMLLLTPSSPWKTAACCFITALLVSSITSLKRWPQYHREIASIVLIAITGLFAFDLLWQRGPLITEFFWLLILPLYATIIYDPKRSSLFTAAAVTIEILVRWLHPPQTIVDFTILSNLTVSTLLIAAYSGIAWYATQRISEGLNIKGLNWKRMRLNGTHSSTRFLNSSHRACNRSDIFYLKSPSIRRSVLQKSKYLRDREGNER